MKLEIPKLLKGAFNQFSDERGYLNPLNLKALLTEMNVGKFSPVLQLMSFSKCENTFRGFHYQSSPCNQAKLLLIHSGQIQDFLVPFDDPKEAKVLTFNLEAGDILFIPDSFAHGFLTKTSDVCLQYLLDKEFNKEFYKGINAIEYVCQFVERDTLIASDLDRAYSKYLELNM